MRILTVGDIHLYHEHTPMRRTVIELLKVIKTTEIDMLVINGDFTHRAIPSLTDSYHLFITVVNEIILHCSANGIILRVVDGTNSHDMGQLQIFNTIIKSLNINIDFKYIDTVTYEENKIGKMLYVPDDMGSHEIVMEDVKQLMIEHKIGSFDFIFIHCMFDFQRPIKSIPCYISEEWMGICSKYILNNHVHNHQRYRNIIAVGSFDRFTFGDDIPKGCVLVETIGLTYTFIENTNTQQYITYEDISDDEELMLLIRRAQKEKNFLKIKTNRPDYVSSKLKTYQIPYYKIETVREERKVQRSVEQPIIKLDKPTILSTLEKETLVDLARIKEYLKG